MQSSDCTAHFNQSNYWQILCLQTAATASTQAWGMDSVEFWWEGPGGQLTRSTASAGIFLSNLLNVCALRRGNLNSVYVGFMDVISSRVGVPSTLIISTSWSTPLSPVHKDVKYVSQCDINSKLLTILCSPTYGYFSHLIGNKCNKPCML